MTWAELFNGTWLKAKIHDLRGSADRTYAQQFAVAVTTALPRPHHDNVNGTVFGSKTFAKPVPGHPYNDAKLPVPTGAVAIAVPSSAAAGDAKAAAPLMLPVLDATPHRVEIKADANLSDRLAQLINAEAANKDLVAKLQKDGLDANEFFSLLWRASSLTEFPQNGTKTQKGLHVLVVVPIATKNLAKVTGSVVLRMFETAFLKLTVSSYDKSPQYLRAVPAAFFGGLNFAVNKFRSYVWDALTMPRTKFNKQEAIINAENIKQEEERRRQVLKKQKKNAIATDAKDTKDAKPKEDNDDLFNSTKLIAYSKITWDTLLQLGVTSGIIYLEWLSGSLYLRIASGYAVAAIAGHEAYDIYRNHELLTNPTVAHHLNDIEQKIIHAHRFSIVLPNEGTSVIDSNAHTASCTVAPRAGEPKGLFYGVAAVERADGKSPIAVGPRAPHGSAAASPAGSPPANSPRAEAGAPGTVGVAVDAKQGAGITSPHPANPTNGKSKFGFDLKLPLGEGRESGPTSPISGTIALTSPPAGDSARTAADLAAFRAKLHAVADAKRAAAKAAAKAKTGDRLAAAAVAAPTAPAPLIHMPIGNDVSVVKTISQLKREADTADAAAADLAALPNVPSPGPSPNSTPEKNKVDDAATPIAAVAIQLRPVP